MVILRKVQAATLVETLVASAIIMIVFMIASLSLNNVFNTMVKGNDTQFQNRIREVSYLIKNEQLSLPFYELTDQWDIEISESEGIIKIVTLYKLSGEEQQIQIEKP